MSDNCMEILVAPTDITTNNGPADDDDMKIITNTMTDKLPSKLKPDMATKKKLTQARLMFKPLDAKSSKPVAACSKKRKLSSDQDTSQSKIAKFQKTNIENKTKPHNNIANNTTTTTTTAATTNNNNINNTTSNSGGGSSNVINNKTNSSSITEMEVCDVISSSGSSGVAAPVLLTVKSHTLDKFFTQRNVQDEIISSSTNGFVDLTKSDGEDNASEKCEENVEKENKLGSNFNEDANFALFSDSQAKPKKSSDGSDGGSGANSYVSDRILKEKFNQAVKSEVKIILPDLAVCDMSICSSPVDSKLINSALSGSSCKYPQSASKSKAPCSKSLVLSTSMEQQKDDSSSELDLSTCATPGNEESSSTSSVDSQSDEECMPTETNVTLNQVTPLASTPKSAQVKQKRRRSDPMRQKIKEERENERLKRKEEKESERLQKLQQRKKDKDKRSQERLHLKLEKDKQREKERLEREKQKDDLRRKKQDITDAKLEEKRKKDEERKIKDEEKVKEKEEEMRKQRKTKAAFQNYFVQKPKSKSVAKPKEHSGMFMPFEVKKDMRMAPADRRSLSKESMDSLDEIMKRQNHQSLYFAELKSRCFKPGKSAKTWPREGEQEDDICYEDVVKKVTYHVKLLQFHTNYRPPYYGTWRKSSNVLSAKYPWKKDTALFDYDVDSDDEWEEEEPGESLSSSEKEEEKDDKEDDEDEEDGWMVPHGYLSEGEGCVEDDEVTPEILKARQAAKAEVWENQRNQQGLPHKPEYIGCIWDGAVKDDILANIFNEYRVMVINGEMPVTTSHNRAPKDMETTENRSGNNPKKRIVPEEAQPDLIKFVHGSRTGIKKLVVEFQSYWNLKHAANMVAKMAQEGETMKTEPSSDSAPGTPVEKRDTCKQSGTPNTSMTEPDAPEENTIISKRQLEKKIMAIAVREKRIDYSKICWYVHRDIRKQYGLEDLPLKDKESEMKAQEEQLAASTTLTASAKSSQQSLPMNLEPKTLSNKNGSNDKPPARPAPTDQMSILSFAQMADKLSSVRTIAAVPTVANSVSSSNNNNNGDNVALNDVKDNAKSPAKKPLPRDQMSILNFAKAAPPSTGKTAPPSTGKAAPPSTGKAASLRTEKSVSSKNADSSLMCDDVIVIDESDDSNNIEMKASSDCKNAKTKASSECKNAKMKASTKCKNGEMKANSECKNGEMKASSECKNGEMKASSECKNMEMKANSECDSNEVKPCSNCDSNNMKPIISCDSSDVRPSSTCESKDDKAECVDSNTGKKHGDGTKVSLGSEVSAAKPQIKTDLPPSTDLSTSPPDCSSTDVEMVEEPKSNTG